MSLIHVLLRIIPTAGWASEKKVEVETTGASLSQVLAKASISAQKMNMSVNGEPVTDMKRLVAEGDTVTLTERAAGS